MNKITIYTTPTCHWCHMTKEYLKSRGISYEEINVVGNVEKQKELIQKSGQMGVPVIDINGNIIVGFDKEKIDKFISEGESQDKKAA